MAKISVIIPVYNTEKYLRCCLDSVTEQTLRDIEIVCVNDGSTDGSLAILRKYAAKDKRIIVINQANKGLSAARNAGLKIATADYISFIDSDDFVYVAFLEQLYHAIQNNNSDIAGCDFVKIRGSREYLPSNKGSEKIYESALNVLLNRKNFIHFNVWNKLYRRELIREIPFIEGMYYEDWVFNTCVFAKAKSFVWINVPLYGYRISENSIMRSSYSIKKMNDYVVGIEGVYNFFCENYPNLWEQVKQTRIARTIKMMMNSAIRSKNNKILTMTKQALKQLRCNRIIGYRGLSLQNKIKLFRFLH